MDFVNKPLTVTNPSAAGAANGKTGALSVVPSAPSGWSEGPAGPPGLAAAPALSGLMHALRRRWLVTASLALLGAATVVLVVLNLVPAKYRVVARLQLSSRAERAVFADDGPDEDFLTYKTNLAASLKSLDVLNTALKEKKNPRPVSWLEAGLKTEFKGPGLLEFTLSADEPDGLADLLNTVVDTALEKMKQEESDRRRNRLKELEGKLTARRLIVDGRKRGLRRAEGDLDDWETAKIKYKAALDKLALLEKELLDNGKEQTRLVQFLPAAEKKADPAGKDLGKKPLSPVQEKDVDEALAKDTPAQNLLKLIVEIDEKILTFERLQEPFRTQEIHKAQNHKAGWQKSYQEHRDLIRKELEARALQKNQKDLVLLQKEEAFLKNRQKKLEEEARKINPMNRPDPLIAEARWIEEEEGNLKKLNEKIAQWNMEPAAASRVKVQRAEDATGKDLARHYKMAGAGAVGMFGLLLFGVAWLEFRQRKISAAADVSQGLGLSLVGTLPNLPARARQPNPAAPRDQILQHQLAEAVDAIRTQLLHAARTEKLQVIMVTSAQGGEGKTSLATQLAASLARAWRKTLLIDGDLRHPATQQLFDVPLEPGFSEVLRGEVNLGDAVRPTAISRLWLMPAGQWDSHALEALAQEAVQQHFEQLKQQYDFIIVDSCPVLPVADALNLGQHVDGVILSVLRDVSRTPAVYAAQQRLGNLGIRTLGAVVIGEAATAGPTYAYPART